MVVVLSYATANNIKQRKYFGRNFFIKNNCYFYSEYLSIYCDNGEKYF